MIVQIHFTDAEMRQYLARLGFTVEPHSFGQFRPAYHNREDWHEYEADAVVIDGEAIEAPVFFSGIIQKSVKQLVNSNEIPFKMTEKKHESDAGPGMLRTFTGMVINVFDPKPEDICIEDIAHALSNLCRFNGHSKKFYSVAEHSIRCADEIEGRNNRLAALMHDAAEAYLGDVPTPIKRMLPDFYKYEYRMMEVIAEKFGFKYPLCIEVEAIDRAMLQKEWHELMQSESHTSTLDPFEARAEFLAAFDRINLENHKSNNQ